MGHDCILGCNLCLLAMKSGLSLCQSWLHLMPSTHLFVVHWYFQNTKKNRNWLFWALYAESRLPHLIFIYHSQRHYSFQIIKDLQWNLWKPYPCSVSCSLHSCCRRSSWGLAHGATILVLKSLRHIYFCNYDQLPLLSDSFVWLRSFSVKLLSLL